MKEARFIPPEFLTALEESLRSISEAVLYGDELGLPRGADPPTESRSLAGRSDHPAGVPEAHAASWPARPRSNGICTMMSGWPCFAVRLHGGKPVVKAERPFFEKGREVVRE